MKKPVKSSIITVVVFTAALFGIYSCLNVSHKGIVDNLSGNWLGDSESDQQVTEYAVAQPINSIYVQWDSGSLYVSSGDESDVKIRELSDETLQIKQHLNYHIANNILYISNGSTSDSSLFHFSKPKIDCEIYVPADMLQDGADSITVSTTKADVQISQIRIPILSVTTESGSVFFDQVFAERMTVVTASGKITSDNGVSNVIECISQSGTIAINDVCSDLILKATSGDISAAPDSIFMRADISTVSGNINLTLPESSGMKMNINEGSGSFDCEFDVLTSGGYYIYKNGKIPLNIKTTSGSIQLYKGKTN